MSELTLSQWLQRIEGLHPSEIELGLDRVREVYRMLPDAPVPEVVTVAGTNGKGSTVECISRCALARGLRVGTYTSPHLVRFNERMCINGEPADDARIVAAFDCVESARGDVALTYFEFTTLAALALFRAEGLDLWVLEVGLGGRLDAVNVVDADVAVITSIGLDHQEWLGDNREDIGREKAGILRSGRPAVCSDSHPPSSIRESALGIGAPLLEINRHFGWRLRASRWDYSVDLNQLDPALASGAATGDGTVTLTNLPVPAGAVLDNLAGGLTALAVLDKLPTRDQLATVLAAWSLRGRLQRIELEATWWLDVAHNAESATLLARALSEARKAESHSECYAVLGMLADKPVDEVIKALSTSVTHWLVVGLDSARALPAAELARKVQRLSPASVEVFESVAAGVAVARARVGRGGTVVVTGSFHTVGPALAWLAL